MIEEVKPIKSYLLIVILLTKCQNRQVSFVDGVSGLITGCLWRGKLPSVLGNSLEKLFYLSKDYKD